SKLTHLLDGQIASGSSDAVTGGQLYSLNDQLVTYLGGTSENGIWKAPSLTVNTIKEDGSTEEQSYANVAAALTGVGSSFTNMQESITKEVVKQISNEVSNVKGESLVKQDAGTHVINIGKEVEGNTINIANSQDELRILSGVKAGALSEASMEAVNGSQLYFMSKQFAEYFGGGAGYKNGEWVAPNFKVIQFSSNGTVVETKDYNNVSGAFGAVNESLSNINDRIRDVENNAASNVFNWNEADAVYDVSHKGQDSQITHVADGEVKKDSTDAINGGQLWETNERVTEVENKVNSIDKQVQSIVGVSDVVVAYDKNDDGTKKNSITLMGGNESSPVLIDHVADGKIEKGSEEAVNGGQLYDYEERTAQKMGLILDDAKKYVDERLENVIMDGVLNDAQAYTDMKFEALTYGIEGVRKEARQAAAIGLAVSNLRYYDIPGSLSLSFGTGLWRSQSAFAIGAGYTSENGNVRSNLSITSAGGHWGTGAGITLRLK
ncbi:Vomp family autotransporter, partial [Bartonella sp. CB169]|uniref:Vomp family autotransporter n=1 Tax=Bartonella sp. CB169 TaxID=3112257 RepID=UPI00300E1104